MTTEREQLGRPSPSKAWRRFCMQCDSEPRGAYLRCTEMDCPGWRFRTGNINRAGKGGLARRSGGNSTGEISSGSSALRLARARILEAERDAKATGKTLVIYGESWPYDRLGYKAGETARAAARRHCRHCMGDLRIADCTSPDCALYPITHRSSPESAAVAPVPAPTKPRVPIC